MSSEECVIKNAAPTLAGIKVANLFNYRFSNSIECVNFVKDMNDRLNKKDIYVEILKQQADFYLIYIYRKSQLSEELKRPEIKAFLLEYGYVYQGEEYYVCLQILKQRLKQNGCFPHEIGVFLGYPLRDVKAFIEKKGKGAIACGEWKVYYDVHNALHFFNKIKECREIYQRAYQSGSNIYDMTVSV